MLVPLVTRPRMATPSSYPRKILRTPKNTIPSAGYLSVGNLRNPTAENGYRFAVLGLSNQIIPRKIVLFVRKKIEVF